MTGGMTHLRCPGGSCHTLHRMHWGLHGCTRIILLQGVTFMFLKVRRIVIVSMALALFVIPSVAVYADGGGGGGNGPVFTVKFKGAAINGVVPEAEVKVDESQALVGGATLMTVT